MQILRPHFSTGLLSHLDLANGEVRLSMKINGRHLKKRLRHASRT